MKLYKFENILNEIASVFDMDQWDERPVIFQDAIKDSITGDPEWARLIRKYFFVEDEDELCDKIQFIKILFKDNIKAFNNFIQATSESLADPLKSLSRVRTTQSFSKKINKILHNTLFFNSTTVYNWIENIPDLDMEEIYGKWVLPFMIFWLDFKQIRDVYIKKFGQKRH